MFGKLTDASRRFRAGGDEATAALLEATVYPEEVTHCAAGVRWLTWLHRQAHAASAPGGQLPPADDAVTAADTAATARSVSAVRSPTAADPSVDDVLALADQLNERCRWEAGAVLESDRRPGHAAYCACCGPGALETDELEEFQLDEAGCKGTQDWARDARQFATVEEWFHALVRRHFFGALKGPFNEVARHEAGFRSEWYLPLAEPRSGSNAQDDQACEPAAASRQQLDLKCPSPTLALEGS